MIKFNELQEWSNDIWPILTDINISITNLRILRTEEENKLPDIHNGFFRLFWHQQRFILIVQLAKIFSANENQKKNINKLCNRFENEGLDERLKNILIDNSSKPFVDVFRTRDDILSAVKSLRGKLGELHNTIENIEKLRNRYYAHSDTKTNLPSIEHYILEELVNLANNTYNTLYGKIFDRHATFERTNDFDIRYVIGLINKK